LRRQYSRHGFNATRNARRNRLSALLVGLGLRWVDIATCKPSISELLEDVSIVYLGCFFANVAREKADQAKIANGVGQGTRYSVTGGLELDGFAGGRSRGWGDVITCYGGSILVNLFPLYHCTEWPSGEHEKLIVRWKHFVAVSIGDGEVATGVETSNDSGVFRGGGKWKAQV